MSENKQEYDVINPGLYPGKLQITLSNGVSFTCEDHDINSLAKLLEKTSEIAYKKGREDAAPKWLSIESAPRNRTPILGARFEKYPNGEIYIDGGIMKWEGNHKCIDENKWIFTRLFAETFSQWMPLWYQPTHWMPLPKFPLER